MADNRTMAQLLQAPTEGYEDAIVIPEINANFELKHGLINLVPRECLRIIESKSKVRNSQNKAVVAKVSSNSSTPEISPDVVALITEVSELKNLMKTMLIDKQKAQALASVKAVEQSCVTCGGAHSFYNSPTNQTLVYQAPTQQMQGISKTEFENYVKAIDAVLWNMQNQGQGLQNQMTNLTKMLSKFITSNTASSSNSGT
ncbi:hypothetical protein Tco_0205965 [Tanacetum coccineum]